MERWPARVHTGESRQTSSAVSLALDRRAPCRYLVGTSTRAGRMAAGPRAAHAPCTPSYPGRWHSPRRPDAATRGVSAALSRVRPPSGGRRPRRRARPNVRVDRRPHGTRSGSQPRCVVHGPAQPPLRRYANARGKRWSEESESKAKSLLGRRLIGARSIHEPRRAPSGRLQEAPPLDRTARAVSRGAALPDAAGAAARARRTASRTSTSGISRSVTRLFSKRLTPVPGRAALRSACELPLRALAPRARSGSAWGGRPHRAPGRAAASRESAPHRCVACA